jgi:hypothetical protein
MPCKTNEPKTPRFETGRLAENSKTACRSEALHVNGCRTKNNLANSATSKDLTLELSGGEAVRLERVVRRLNYLHLTVFIAPAVQGRL